jgi:hypothetical protein
VTEAEGFVTTKPNRLLWYMGLFVYGTATHLLLVRIFAHWDYASPANRDFINHPLLNAGIAMLGGISVSILLFPLLLRTISCGKPKWWPFLARGGAYGIVATAIALQAFLILLGAYLTFQINAGASPSQLPGVFLLWMIDIEMFGCRFIAQSIPFGFVDGIVIAAATLLLNRRNQTLRPPLHTNQ